ncbi:MAG: bifunctional phosphopantothenoylcysteine decarboxylase/phosphopantothenate--cysteine ligase CoaBC [Chitinispirillales bacterium]|jgi:phosphopantothenoylcysteine decarboxylase/phosphopantothenate--cysteine ligase|nr:bifunctional phosphopantothenoylcysteine decarboxylase/phosphopantothenate--cysteine ligase CoaBC [Chitinispirillales bacterium]
MTKLSAENSNSKNILLGISGGISAYKIPFLVRILKKRGHNVKVILTNSAKKLVATDTLKTLSGFPVYSDDSIDYDMNHIRLNEWADVFVLAPATANSIAKMAHGIADNLLSTTFLSLTCPIVVVPAMNTAMLENAATQANIKKLKNRGIIALPTAAGELACGAVGAGRMIEPDDIAEYVTLALQNTDLFGKFAQKTICIASGPTVEPIDAVRSITNSSSGKMGAALARAAIFAGAKVVVVSGPASAKLPTGIELIKVNTASQMRDAMMKNLPDCDIVVMAAAVGDFRVENVSSEKISRENNAQYTINLIKNPDIAKEIGKKKKTEQKLVVFSLETNGGIERAIQKMSQKNADLCVFNDADDALGKDCSKITIIRKDEQIFEFDKQSKTVSAAKILELL